MNDKTPAPTSATKAAIHEAWNMALMGRHASPALQIMLDPALFDRAKLIATYMAKAEGMIPRHLIGKSEACFAVVVRSITWKLDPFAVATCTYQTPGGSVGFEGKLCQAVLENSGKLEGPVTFEHYGDWSKVQGKFEIATSGKGNQFAKATWTDTDAKGCGVTVSAKVVGEAEPRTWSFDLVQAYPRNSTLWATDPKTQICYTAVRRFANVAAPGLFMGVPFDRDEAMEFSGPESARDITPSTGTGERPRPEDFDGSAPAEPEQPTTVYELVDEVGEVLGSFSALDFDKKIGGAINRLGTAKNVKGLEQIMENNDAVIATMAEDGETGRVSDLREFHGLRLKEARAAVNKPAPEPEPAAAETADPAPEPAEPEPEPQADDTVAEGEEVEEAWGDEPPTPPAVLVWTSTNGRKNTFENLEKWVTAVSGALSRCPDVGMLETARKNNAATLAEYHALGDTFAAAVEAVETAFTARREELVG